MVSKFTLFLVLAAFGLSNVYAGTYYVRVDGDNNNDGRSWNSAFASVQKAINSANYGDTVKVEEGEYFPEYTLNASDVRTKTFKLKNGVKLFGGYRLNDNSLLTGRDYINYPTVLSGDLGIKGDTTDNAYHVIYNSIENSLDNNTLLDGITITGGNAHGAGVHSSGGGMYLSRNSNLIVKNCTVEGNSASSGAGIYNYGNPRIKIINTIFKDNFATNGGGIFNSLESNTLIDECLFENNKAKNGAAVYNSTGKIKISNSELKNNLSGFGSTIYNYSCRVTLSNNLFTGNTSISNGGVIYNFISECEVTDCIFASNNSNQSGGAVSDFNKSKSKFVNCIFNYNTAAKHGGAYRSELNSYAEFINCTFFENETIHSGGAIYIKDKSEILVTNTEIEGNQAGNSGGGMSIDGYSKCTIERGNIKGNKARFGGGIEVDTNGTLVLTKSIIDSNEAIISGGGIFGEFADMTIKNTEFYKNTGKMDGGGMTTIDGKLIIDSCEVHENNSPIGAGILFEKIDANLKNSHIHRNNGSGLVISQCSPMIENCLFEANRTNSRGAGLYALQGNGTFLNCTFLNNIASGTGRGGAIYNYGSDTKFTDCTFKGNEANYGGVIFNYKSYGTIDRCEITENIAYESGGAISNWGDTCFVDVTNSKIANNSAKSGAAFFSSGESTITNVTNSLITHNNSQFFGGGFHIRMGARVNIINCTFSGNNSGMYGGAVYGINSYTIMYNTIIWDNFAEKEANSVYSVDGYTLIYNSCLPDGDVDIYGNAQFFKCIYKDPQFAQESDYPLALYGSSPCIDKGNDRFITEEWDIRGEGFRRKIQSNPKSGDIVDIGAFEYHEGIDPEYLALPTPELKYPKNTQKHVNITSDFEWTNIQNADEYEIQLGSNLEFEKIHFSKMSEDNETTISGLEKTTVYYWRVRAYNDTDTSNWSLTRKFNTVGKRIYVNLDATGLNNGTNWNDAFTSFQNAVDSSGYGDSIYVAEGIYYPEKIIKLPGEFSGERKKAFHMKDGVVMYGGFPGHGNPELKDRDYNQFLTVLSGNIGEKDRANDNSFHVIYNHKELMLDSTAVIDGFVISDGQTSGVPNSPDSFGAGINNGDSNPTIKNCTFVNNRALGGGGIFNAGHEEYYRGGAKIINCNFHNNYASKGGGAMRNYKSVPLIVNSNFTQNVNGIHNIKSDAVIINSNFALNDTAVRSVNSYPRIINCTITENTYGISSEFYSEPVIMNSIIRNNNKDFSFIDSEVKVFNSCINDAYTALFSESENNIYDDPKLYESENFYRILTWDSPCVDAGENSYYPDISAYDLKGDRRIYNSTIDIGAFEWHPNQDTTSVFEDDGVEISIYPNPATDFIIINSEIYISNVELLDINGNKALASDFDNQIDLQNIPSGMYILRLNSFDKAYFRKIVIER